MSCNQTFLVPGSPTPLFIMSFPDHILQAPKVTCKKTSKKPSDDDGSAKPSTSLSRHRPKVYSNAPSNGMCQVCTVVPFQFHHFGAFVCNRCRAFFRRTVRRERSRVPLAPCITTKEVPVVPKLHVPVCDITLFRGACQACRYVICLRAGMNADSVLTDADRVKKYSRKRRRSLSSRRKAAVIRPRKDRVVVTTQESKPPILPTIVQQPVQAWQPQQNVLLRQHPSSTNVTPTIVTIPLRNYVPKVEPRNDSVFYYGEVVEYPPWLPTTTQGPLRHTPVQVTIPLKKKTCSTQPLQRTPVMVQKPPAQIPIRNKQLASVAPFQEVRKRIIVKSVLQKHDVHQTSQTVVQPRNGPQQVQQTQRPQPLPPPEPKKMNNYVQRTQRPQPQPLPPPEPKKMNNYVQQTQRPQPLPPPEPKKMNNYVERTQRPQPQPLPPPEPKKINNYVMDTFDKSVCMEEFLNSSMFEDIVNMTPVKQSIKKLEKENDVLKTPRDMSLLDMDNLDYDNNNNNHNNDPSVLLSLPEGISTPDYITGDVVEPDEDASLEAVSSMFFDTDLMFPDEG